MDKTKTTKNRWALSIVINPFNFHIPKFQKCSIKDFNGRMVTTKEILIGPFSFGFNTRLEDSYDN